MVVDENKKLKQCPKCGNTSLSATISSYYCPMCHTSYDLSVLCLDNDDKYGSLGIFELIENNKNKTKDSKKKE